MSLEDDTIEAVVAHTVGQQRHATLEAINTHNPLKKFNRWLDKALKIPGRCLGSLVTKGLYYTSKPLLKGYALHKTLDLVRQIEGANLDFNTTIYAAACTACQAVDDITRAEREANLMLATSSWTSGALEVAGFVAERADAGSRLGRALGSRLADQISNEGVSRELQEAEEAALESKAYRFYQWCHENPKKAIGAASVAFVSTVVATPFAVGAVTAGACGATGLCSAT